MAFTREQTEALVGGMDNAHLADTISNPSFDADARHHGVAILIDRNAKEANRPAFAAITQAIQDARAAAAEAAKAELAEETK